MGHYDYSRRVLTPLSSHEYISNLFSTSGHTVRPPHIANKIFPMATSAIGRHVESGQYQYYISTGHRLCPIIMKLALYDLQTKQNKHAKQLFLIQNHLAVTANQTWQQSRQTGSKPVLSISLTCHSQTWYIDSWHHSGVSHIAPCSYIYYYYHYLFFKLLNLSSVWIGQSDLSWHDCDSAYA